MKNFNIIVPVLFLLSSCSHVGRYIASTPLNPPKLDNLLEASQQILSDVEDHSFPTVCVDYLSSLEMSIDELDVRKLPADQLIVDAELISKNSWDIRSKLHSRLSEFDKDCVMQVQSTFRQFRFIEDYLLEQSRKVTDLKPSEIDFQNQPIPMLDVTVPFYEQKFNGPLKFEPGDLLITRGVSFMSGMIARLGQRATQFSHVVMMYEDPKTKSMKTIESYVGGGVDFYNLEFALKNENARILWLRAKDKQVAKKASELMYQYVKEKADAGKPIQYDYALNFDEHTTVSCGEVSKMAFAMADKDFKIPYYPNQISATNSIIKRLKMVEGETFEPGDMEIDPRFELIGEFHDLRLTRDSRQKDAVMSAIFSWMENKDYVLQDTFESNMAGTVIYTARKTFLWPLVKKALKIDDFSKSIPRNMLKTVKLVNQLGEVLLEQLHAKDLEFEELNGVPMSYTDFYKALEEIRENDLKLYQNKKTRKQSKFHNMIRPKN